MYTSRPTIPLTGHTSASPLSIAAIVGIAVSGTVILVVVLLLPITFLLARKYLHSKQTVEQLYEIPDAIDFRGNDRYKANSPTQHITTTANEAYGCVGDIPVIENVAYRPAPVNIPTVPNEAYGSVSGASVNNDTEEKVNMDEMYIYMND